MHTEVTGLKILGEAIDVPGGELTQPVTRTHSVETNDVVALLRGLGVDPSDIDQYAPMVGSSRLKAELAVTAAPDAEGGVAVDLDMEVDLAAVSASDEETPPGALFNVELHAANTVFSATLGGIRVTDEPVAAPTVTELNPTGAVAGDVITVRGANFLPGATVVMVDGMAATDVAVLDEGATLTFLVPEGAAGADLPVMVKTRGGQANAGTLTVTAPISITEQPKSLTIEAGETARFTATAKGHPVPSVQWQFRTALGGGWADIDGDAFPSARTETLTLPAEAAWTGLQLRAVFRTDGQELASSTATLTVNAATGGPVTSDKSALASPVKVGAIALILSGQASGGTFAGLINGELSKGVDLGEPGRFTLTETGSPAPGKTLRSEYPSGSTATGAGIGDLDSGVVFGPVTVENAHNGQGITSTSTIASFTMTDKALDKKGRIGAVADLSEIVSARGVTATATAPSDKAAATSTQAHIDDLRIFGEPITAADGLVNGVITTPITKVYSKQISDVPSVLAGLNIDISSYFDDPAELVGAANMRVEVTVSQPHETSADQASATGLVVTGKLSLDLTLDPIGNAAAFVKHVEITSNGLGEAFTVELAGSKVARNGAKLPEPGDGGGPVDPVEPEEPEEPLPFVSYKPSEAPDRLILNPTDNMATSQSVTWRTAETETGGAVEYWPTEAGSAQKQTVQGATGEVVTATSDEEGEYASRKHSATITGLTPATSYTYRVGTAGAWSGTHTFRTAAGTAKPFTFMYVGDAQNDLRRKWEPAIQQAFTRMTEAELVLHAGDQINHADKDNEWGEWFGAMKQPAAQVNQLMVAGNHEYYNGSLGKTWRESFTLPQNGPTVTADPGTCDYVYQRKMTASMKDIVYYTDYQGVRFVTLGGTTQAGDLLPSPSDLASVTCPPEFNFLDQWFKIQAEWLDKVLAENPGKWSVVSIHQPIFSTSEGRDNTHLRQFLLPVVEKHNVDLVLQGHDHTYGRGHLKSNDVAGTRSLQRGPVYVVSVLGPKSYKLDTNENNDWNENGADRVTAYEGVRTYQSISVNGGRLDYRAIEWKSGKVVDSFEICKRPDGTKVATKSGAADLPAGCDQAAGLANVEAPEVLGTAEVGRALHAEKGVWSEAGGLSFAYQWLRDGLPIAGATERAYTVGAGDLGTVLSVRVDASKSGAGASSATSAGTAKVRAGSFANTSLPRVTGQARVGRELSADGGRWSQEAELGYQWLADGRAIPGATGERFTLGVAQLDSRISVRVTAQSPGSAAIDAESGVTDPVAEGTIAVEADPTLSGTPKVGELLRATAGEWSHEAATVRYEWLRDGRAIPGATGAQYRLTAADLGAAIGVRITASATGYADRSTTVRGSKLTALGTLAKPSVKISGTAAAGKRVTASAKWSTTGVRATYTWKVGGKVVQRGSSATYRISAKDRGKRLTVTVTGTKAGHATVSAEAKSKKVAKAKKSTKR